jgi:D-beta-D-heptose 7-phosphate kinase/D-beta-D-heptose 1-phosphate adenosyltransferase
MTTVIVNGTFDILHPGHIAMLNTARSLGDYLIVCIDTDRRVKELKGDTRPINNEDFRRTMLHNIKSVDVVELFDSQEELISLFEMYKPDIMVKGSDWKGKSIVAEQYIKEIYWYDRIEEYSSTEIIERIANR